MKSEQYRGIKKQINKEGFQAGDSGEGDEKGPYGAAVFVGTKEEIKKAREQAESEGRAPDLESYIRLNKEIVATAEEMKDMDFFQKLKPGSYEERFFPFSSGSSMYYKDKEGNLAAVFFEDFKKIEEFARDFPKGRFPTNTDQSEIRDKIFAKLQDLGFSLKPYNSSEPEFVEIGKEIENKRMRKRGEEAEKGFNF